MTNNDKNNNSDKSKQYKTLITEYWGRIQKGIVIYYKSHLPDVL